jgi:hypothetical protein
VAHPNCHFPTVRKELQALIPLREYGNPASEVLDAAKGQRVIRQDKPAV